MKYFPCVKQAQVIARDACSRSPGVSGCCSLCNQVTVYLLPDSVPGTPSCFLIKAMVHRSFYTRDRHRQNFFVI